MMMMMKTVSTTRMAIGARVNGSRMATTVLPARNVVVRANRGSEAAQETANEVMGNINSGAEELADKLQKYWEESEDKPTLVATGFGALLALYFLNSVVGALDRLPLISNVFELIGIIFSGWTAYRYFLVEGEKEKLTADVKSFASKVGIDL